MDVWILYTNYKGETRWRNILPLHIKMESNKWHPITQWLLKAYDFEQRSNRTFAIKDIHKWSPHKPTQEEIDGKCSLGHSFHFHSTAVLPPGEE